MGAPGAARNAGSTLILIRSMVLLDKRFAPTHR